MLEHSCESLEVSARLADSVGARRSSGPRASRSHLQPDGRFGLSPPPQVSFMVCHMIRCSNSIVRGAQAHPQGDVDPPPLVERYRRSRAPVSRRHVAGPYACSDGRPESDVPSFGSACDASFCGLSPESSWCSRSLGAAATQTSVTSQG